MKRRTPFVALYGFCLCLGLAASVRAQEVKLDAPQTRMTTVSAVRARSAPQVSATEVARLKLGTVLKATARSAEETEIGGKRDYWYLVSLPSGQSAWVFGGLTTPFDAARREEIVRRIIDERLKVEGMSFDDGVDFYNFVSGALAEAKDTNAKAEFELLRLLALGRAVSPIPYAERERAPYAQWYKAHEAEIVYSEPSGQWLLRSELFWNLERKYRATPTAERIAWEGAENPLPGECEGDEVCYFLYLNDTQGKYLSLYPNGAHASEVLKNFEQALASTEVESTLKSTSRDKYLIEQRDALKQALTQLRSTVAKTSAAEKAPVLRLLERLSAAAR
ncbi:MAG TPA: SH3 domain-containing protein [Pyrinomonadaceae bacterium]|jgi:hypothetical protein